MQKADKILDVLHPVELELTNLWQNDDLKDFQEIPHKLWILLIGVDLFQE
jgi:hypothetical protein